MDEVNLHKLSKLTALSAGDYQAFLYDCDGTLADNMPLHTETYVDLAAEMGVQIDGQIIDELAGWPVVDVVREINKRYNVAMDPVVFAERRHRLYVDHYLDRVVAIPFVVAHLEQHVGKVRIAVVSGGARESVEKTLKVLGIDRLVEVTVCAGDTLRGKPYPDPFLAAAEQLGVLPEKCLVFEDGAPGVASATAAGMQSIRIDHV
ncbi:HAD family hydrolase [Sphingobacterium psychroaquaticum]|uniref:Haloacid dehalogenase superfamily, subfamily IA, variant 3 with third motif having DD or ED n=1 Tax=Sphingobacterium psychroaquaticum TaxID=561061 RepID=A0A1X7I9X1_9SPHI|nr:HAD-IA family hydrolase [Sphingobacterium psychroaquaticum]QBQ41821.1 HAD family hydrolase [Sphingobacterium psychroaquaticum]SMG10919.1 haloacid dehalogenase superfamily, subfamily IA, variant 3 with third motif having DD or ED [Sphingobacterium psychroaquaticum]